MMSPVVYRLKRLLHQVEVRTEPCPEGHVVVLSGQHGSYRSEPFSAREADAIKHFLWELAAEGSGDASETTQEVVERWNRRSPNVPTASVRDLVDQAVQESWSESTLAEALNRKSYALILENYRGAHMWGVLIMTQRDENVCSGCQELDNVAYRLGRAIDEQPLPHSGCENRMCRCRYLPVLREEDLYDRVDRRV